MTVGAISGAYRAGSEHLALSDRGNVSAPARDIEVANLDNSLMLRGLLSDRHLAKSLAGCQHRHGCAAARDEVREAPAHGREVFVVYESRKR